MINDSNDLETGRTGDRGTGKREKVRKTERERGR